MSAAFTSQVACDQLIEYAPLPVVTYDPPGVPPAVAATIADSTSKTLRANVLCVACTVRIWMGWFLEVHGYGPTLESAVGAGVGAIGTSESHWKEMLWNNMIELGLKLCSSFKICPLENPKVET